MGWSRRNRPAGVTPDMNVTPLVDVVLVLLIIFMVVAPQLEHDVEVNLPGIFNPDPEVESGVDPLKVTVAKVGEYHYNEQQYDLDGVIEQLGMAHAEEPTRRLILRGDERLLYGQVRELLNRAQQVGFPGIALMVGERHKQGKVAATTALPDTPADPGNSPPPEGS